MFSSNNSSPHTIDNDGERIGQHEQACCASSERYLCPVPAFRCGSQEVPQEVPKKLISSRDNQALSDFGAVFLKKRSPMLFPGTQEISSHSGPWCNCFFLSRSGFYRAHMDHETTNPLLVPLLQYVRCNHSTTPLVCCTTTWLVSV